MVYTQIILEGKFYLRGGLNENIASLARKSLEIGIIALEKEKYLK